MGIFRTFFNKVLIKKQKKNSDVTIILNIALKIVFFDKIIV